MRCRCPGSSAMNTRTTIGGYCSAVSVAACSWCTTGRHEGALRADTSTQTSPSPSEGLSPNSVEAQRSVTSQKRRNSKLGNAVNKAHRHRPRARPVVQKLGRTEFLRNMRIHVRHSDGVLAARVQIAALQFLVRRMRSFASWQP